MGPRDLASRIAAALRKHAPRTVMQKGTRTVMQTGTASAGTCCQPLVAYRGRWVGSYLYSHDAILAQV
eukprot:5495280-Heterocapsa_arctica.AAC.1